jgi:carboxylesterase
MPQIIPSAEPFLFPGSRTGCLLIHGYTGAPKEMRWLGEYLAALGYSVLGIRLAGHATHIEDMRRSQWTDWVASVEDGYHILCGFTDRIYLIGLSTGGVLSLLMSTQLDVKGVVAISTPYRMSVGALAHFIWLVGRFWPYLPKSREAPGSGWFDKQAWKEHVSYDRTPVASVAEFTRLLAAMHNALPRVRVPVLLIHSEDDRFVVPENLDHVFEALPDSIDKTRLLVQHSGHVVTRDAAREQVFAATAQFIQRLESQSE